MFQVQLVPTAQLKPKTPPAKRDPSRRWSFVDLQMTNYHVLLQAGVKAEHIDTRTSHCTKCNPDLYFSYERDGFPFGNQIGFVCMPSNRWRDGLNCCSAIRTKTTRRAETTRRSLWALLHGLGHHGLLWDLNRDRGAKMARDLHTPQPRFRSLLPWWHQLLKMSLKWCIKECWICDSYWGEPIYAVDGTLT